VDDQRGAGGTRREKEKGRGGEALRADLLPRAHPGKGKKKERKRLLVYLFTLTVTTRSEKNKNVLVDLTLSGSSKGERRERGGRKTPDPLSSAAEDSGEGGGREKKDSLPML